MKDDVRPNPPAYPVRIIPVALLGAKTDNGGEVSTATSKIECKGIPVALVGDKIRHAKHGEVTITTGHPGVRWHGKPVAVAGSLTSDGGYILEPGQSRMIIVEYSDGTYRTCIKDAEA